MRKSASLVVSVFMTASVYSQEAANFDPPVVAPSFQAIETTDIILLDGRLTEPAWSTASVFSVFIALSTLPGIGTAIVYPTFLAAISDYTHPDQRPKSIGVFRLWRDLGYAIGAGLTGLIADCFGPCLHPCSL
jgi:MFS family permease